jgi:hypothetical protein
MKATCTRPANGSALPCPSGSSASAGTSAWRIAIRLTIEAAASSAESNRLESMLTEPVCRNAPNLSTIRNSARPDRREAGEPHQAGVIGGRRDRHG